MVQGAGHSCPSGGIVSFAVSSEMGIGTGLSGSIEHARRRIVRELVESPARSVRPSRRAVFRALVKNAPVGAGDVATSATEAPPVTLTGVTEVLALPGQSGDSYRVTLDVQSSRTEPVTLDVLGLEVGDTSVWSLPRQPVVGPGAQRLTLVAGGKIGDGRLTLSYELDGLRHQVSAILPSRSA
jgi:hypothetical protein